MHIRPGRYIAGIFYAEISDPAPRGNVMGWVYRDEDIENIDAEGEWFFYFRTRYYHDNDLTRASKDVRKPHLFMKRGLLRDLYPEFQGVFKLIALAGGCLNPDVIPVNSADPEVVMKILGEQKWAHMSKERGSSPGTS